jgi:outer membrane protein assembly factor BamD (BamD/ComL family)
MFKKYRHILALISFAIIGFTACKSQYDVILYGNDVPAKYALAFEMFEAKKYLKAAELFESLTIATNGTPQDDTVQYYWGLE